MFLFCLKSPSTLFCKVKVLKLSFVLKINYILQQQYMKKKNYSLKISDIFSGLVQNWFAYFFVAYLCRNNLSHMYRQFEHDISKVRTSPHYSLWSFGWGWKTEAPCHNRCGRIKVLSIGQNFAALHRQWWRFHTSKILSSGT